MRDGEKDGRVTIADVVDHRSVGLGALAGLSGEILVVDGVAWVGRAASTGVVVERAQPNDQAALLLLAEVGPWKSATLEAESALDDLDPKPSGAARTTPFIVRGNFAQLELHVLAGRCPYAPDDDEGDDAVRRTFDGARGTLVGFVTDEAPGVIAHHGSRLHVHALLEEPEPFVGHVDAAVIRSGSLLLVPAER